MTEEEKIYQIGFEAGVRKCVEALEVEQKRLRDCERPKSDGSGSSGGNAWWCQVAEGITYGLKAIRGSTWARNVALMRDPNMVKTDLVNFAEKGDLAARVTIDTVKMLRLMADRLESAEGSAELTNFEVKEGGSYLRHESDHQSETLKEWAHRTGAIGSIVAFTRFEGRQVTVKLEGFKVSGIFDE